MLNNFTASKSPTNQHLIVIYAAHGMQHSVACVLTLDALADLFGKRTISQDDALRVVRAEIDKFAKIISAKFEEDPFAFTAKTEVPHLLRYDLTLRDLQLGGLSYSASVLDAPATVWGKDGKF